MSDQTNSGMSEAGLAAALHVPEGACLVIYDGACGFCRKAIANIRRRDRKRGFVFVPRATPGLEEAYPVVTDGDFDSGMRLIDENGRLFVGSDAIHQIASRLPYYRRLAWVYRVPVLHHVAGRAYAWVAAHRMKLSGYCSETPECRLEERT